MNPGVEIATMIVRAKTPEQKRAATRKLNQYLDSRSKEGASRERVHAGIKSTVTRLRKRKQVGVA